MNYALLLAGGSGSRTGDQTPKQFLRAGGMMMLTKAISPLIRSESVDLIWIVSSKEHEEEILTDIRDNGLDTEKIKGFAEPGITRQHSILNGLTAIKDNSDIISEGDTVLIHDAARPFLTESLLEDIYRALTDQDGIMPYLPMKDTVYLADNDRIEGRLIRSKVVAGQSPELFRFNRYLEANLALTQDELLSISGAAEPALMAGMNIGLTPGLEANFKITTADDLKKFLLMS
jgi:2-C-methyl-D-erythritol 4-phosphate cytidylyltransferase